MLNKILRLAFWIPFVVQLSAQTPTGSSYYHTCPSGIGCYKMEAIRQMITPQMCNDAVCWSSDPRLRELVTMARALDSLMYDGVRLVRERGLLVDNDAIDDFATYRTVFYFNVSPTEARAWLLASRLIQMEKSRDGEGALSAMETEMSATAVDLALRLKTYFGERNAIALMPHFDWQIGGSVQPLAMTGGW